MDDGEEAGDGKEDEEGMKEGDERGGGEAEHRSKEVEGKKWRWSRREEIDEMMREEIEKRGRGS